MKFTLGFSPCPNDTYIFDALVNAKIDTEGFSFEAVLEDVQTLNEWAVDGKLDITKLSFPALFQNSENYKILNAGAALGKGVGPLLIGLKMVALPSFENCRIAIPGENTTANFLLHYAFPLVKNTIPMLFSSVEDAVLNGKVDMGVIIHENRFTYQQKGLHKICDLGEIWEQREALPIPLGCIAIKKDIDAVVQKKIDALIRKSVLYAFENNQQLSSYVVAHAQAMEQEVMRQHIGLYVNDFSVDLKEEGRKAITKLYSVFSAHHNLQAINTDLFI